MWAKMFQGAESTQTKCFCKNPNRDGTEPVFQPAGEVDQSERKEDKGEIINYRLAAGVRQLAVHKTREKARRMRSICGHVLLVERSVGRIDLL
jgi:hypothetical protein